MILQHESRSALQRGQQRIRRINLTVLASIAFRGALFLSGLVYVPLTVHYLGPDRYGLWVAMTSVMTLLAFADCGIGYGLMNHVASAPGRREEESVRKSISSTFFVLCGISLLGCLLLAIAYPFVPWQSAFRTKGPLETTEAARAIAVMVTSFLLTLPFTTVQRVQAAHQEGFETQLWEIAGVVLSLFGLVAAIRLHAGLPVLAIVFTLGPLLAVVMNWLVYFLLRRPSEAPVFKFFEFHMARTIIHEGGYFLVLQIAGTLVFSIDTFVILHYFGQAELGKYNLAAKLFQIAPALAGVCFAPLWPAYAESIASGDIGWVRRTLFWSTLASSIGCAISSCGAALFARPLIRIWTGADINPSVSLLCGFATCSVILVSTSAVATYLNGSGYIRPQAKLVVATTLLSVPLKILLSKYGNVAGPVWGTNIAYMLTIIPAYLIVVPRLVRKHNLGLGELRSAV